jgi:hypothetical protein
VSVEVTVRPPRRWRRYVVAGAVLVVAAAGAAVAWKWRQVSAAMEVMGLFGRAAAELRQGLNDGAAVSARFLDDLRHERWDDAYAATTDDFRRRFRPVDLERLALDHPAMSGSNVKLEFMLIRAPPHVNINVAEHPAKNPDAVELLLVDDGGGVKVARVSLGGRSLP